jgi:hypothetical protein
LVCGVPNVGEVSQQRQLKRYTYVVRRSSANNPDFRGASMYTLNIISQHFHLSAWLHEQLYVTNVHLLLVRYAMEVRGSILCTRKIGS